MVRRSAEESQTSGEQGVSDRDVCLLATVPYSLAVFLTPHIKALSRTNRVTLVANGSAEAQARGLGTSLSFLQLGAAVEFQHLDISRGISIRSDIIALVQLWRLFRRRRFHIVQSITPKAGLLSMLAARVAGVPIRVHWFTGQVWATKSGASRWLLKSMDRLLVRCSTHVLSDSPSQRDFLVREGVVKPGQMVVLGQGSVSGVDTARFRPNADARSRIRAAVRIPDDAVVALFLGRLTRDKGLPELSAAFVTAARECPTLHLIVVGPNEGHMRESMAESVGEFGSRMHFVDYTNEPEAYMAAADMFVLPSRREGFGSSVIEAAACGVPAIGTRIYGLSDAIADGESGILVPLGDGGALASAMIRLATDRGARLDMGIAARIRVEGSFKEEHLTAALMQFYRELLSSQGES
jgi:glycosyltransferase involved in cell wall biosynthesis